MALERGTDVPYLKLSPRLLLEGSGSELVGQVLDADELNVLTGHSLLGHAGPEEQISERYALPYVGRDPARSPVEPYGLTDHVLFLPAVAGAHEGDWQLPRLHAHQLVHADLERRSRDLRMSTHLDGVFVPLEVGTGAVIPHVVQARGGDELVLVELR